MGESSGGEAVCILALSPRAKGLFKRAVVSSGPCVGGWGPESAAYGASMARAVAAGLNATTLAQLRAVPASALAAWPATAESDDQLFPGYFMDPYFMPVRLPALPCRGRLP